MTPYVGHSDAASLNAAPFYYEVGGTVNGADGTTGVSTFRLGPTVTNQMFSGDLTYLPRNDTYGRISISGMSLLASIKVKVFVRWEGVPALGSQFYSMANPVPIDMSAVLAQRYLWAQMKSAYPSEYNDAGEIWDIISGAIKAIAPFLSAVPVVGPALTFGASAVAGTGDLIRQALSHTRNSNVAGEKASQADVSLVSSIPAAQMPLRARNGPRGVTWM
jgi:hypothetical protein